MAKCLPIIYFFSTDFASVGELVSQHIDVLGPMPPSWWMHWRERGQFFDDDGRPKEARYVWPRIEEALKKVCRSIDESVDVSLTGRKQLLLLIQCGECLYSSLKNGQQPRRSYSQTGGLNGHYLDWNAVRRWSRSLYLTHSSKHVHACIS
jgi:hypothetical protein